MLIDAAMFVSVIVLIILWVWPDPPHPDPYDDPKNWGDQ